MFGQESIYGQTMVTMDYKGRLFLPKFTYIEPKESLLIIDKQDYLSIYKEETYDEKIKHLETLYMNSTSDKKREVELELLKLYDSILKKVKSDSQHRINLGGIETESNNFLCVGARNHIILKTKCINKK